MIQYDIAYLTDERNIRTIVNEIEPILNRRKEMVNRYTRKGDTKDIIIPLEYYITKIATGYFGGKAPEYKVKQETDDKKKNIIASMFDKVVGENDDPLELEMVIDYIREYNDDPTFFYEMVKDYVITGACYGINYENEENEIVYAHVPSTQSVMVYDYSTPVNKIGLIRVWTESDSDGNEVDMVCVITDTERRYYKNDRKDKEYKEDASQKEDVTWLLVPAIGVENPEGMGMFENVLTLIDAYENIIKNHKNMFQYNDEAKLKVTGYMPENPLTITDESGNVVQNPDRIKEDELLLNAKVFYTADASGNIEWITKSIDDSASENHKKTLMELVLMMTCVPNVTDVGFTNADNASALEKKFFPLEQVMIEADKLFKKELLYMWENIIDRINTEKGKNYDFRNIQIELKRNMPTEINSVVDTSMKLRGLLSDETIIKMLPYDLDAQTELAKAQQQSEDNLLNQMEVMKSQKGIDDELEESGQGTETVPDGVQEEPDTPEGPNQSDPEME